jgi:serum/glucocorticoid-regulated kinase 2
MVSQSGHDLTVDWWAIGILIYEMVVGVTPFYNKNRQVLTSKIKHSKVVWPDKTTYKIEYSNDMIDLVS